MRLTKSSISRQPDGVRSRAGARNKVDIRTELVELAGQRARHQKFPKTLGTAKSLVFLTNLRHLKSDHDIYIYIYIYIIISFFNGCSPLRKFIYMIQKSYQRSRGITKVRLQRQFFTLNRLVQSKMRCENVFITFWASSEKKSKSEENISGK